MKEKDFIDVNSLLNLKVAQYASPCSHYLIPESSVVSALEIMELYDIRHLPVLSDKRPVGIVSDRNLLFFKGKELAYSTKVTDVMNPLPFTVAQDSSLEDAVETMAESKIGSAIVVNSKDECMGILTTSDLLTGILDILRGDLPEAVETLEGGAPEAPEDLGTSLEQIDLENERAAPNLNWE